MASSSGNSSAGIKNSSSDEDLTTQIVGAPIDERKRKRMESNRESARRSRMRKQKHLDELNNQVADLRIKNNQILNTISFTTQQFLAVEAENSVLRAQVAELSSRLDSLNEILGFIHAGVGAGDAAPAPEWGLGGCVGQLPIMASCVDYHPEFGC